MGRGNRRESLPRGWSHCSALKSFLPRRGLWQEMVITGRIGCIAFPLSLVKLLWTLAGALLDRHHWLHFKWHVGYSWRENWVLLWSRSIQKSRRRNSHVKARLVRGTCLRQKPRDARPQYKEGHMEKLAKEPAVGRAKEAASEGFRSGRTPVLHNVIQWGKKKSHLPCSSKLRQHFLEKLIKTKFFRVKNDLERSAH